MSKKRKKTGLEAFILDEAEVDDDAIEEEDYDEDDFNDLIDRDKRSEVEAAAAQVNQADMSKHRRLQMMWEDRDADEIENYYKEKYAEQSARESSFHMHKDSEELNEEITQTAHLPTVKDPNLWMVKCLIGAEKTAALQLMRKFIAYEKMKDDPGPLQIKSVIVPGVAKGYIYIEAYKQTHVKQAIDGINNIRKSDPTMVPISEMTDVLRVVKEKPKIKRDQFVRLKRSLYRGDLAQVDYVDAASNTVCLRLKPRIDYNKMRGALRTAADKESKKRTRTRPPAAKLFDVDAIRGIGGEITSDGDFQIFEGNRYRRGLLYKIFPMDAIIVDGVKPTLNELESTEEQGLDQAELQLGAEKDTKFAPGDKVEVCEGELIHLQGKILTIDGSRVTMLPNHAELKDPLEFPSNELKKCFDEGDHVKVIDGRYEGDTGTIVRTDEKNAILLSDMSMDEIKVLIRDLQLCQDRATGVDSLGHFNYGDLVQLDATNVGVIVRLEKESLQILNQAGHVRPYKSQAVTKKSESNKKAVALDKDSNHIQVKDQVTVVDGAFKGKTAVVKHIYRSFVFLHSKTVIENGGMFVVKARNLQVIGSTTNRTLTTGFGAAMNAGYMSPRIQSPHHPSTGRPEPLGAAMAPGAFGGRNSAARDLIGKTIKISKGSYKGHIGIVKDARDGNARVELHSDCKTITVAMQNIKMADGTTIPSSGMPILYSTRTPAYSAATPSHHGSRTPSHFPGSQTPNPNDYGSQTPMHTSQTPRADFDMDEAPSPKAVSSYVTPNTPNYQPPDTPDVDRQPYTPQTSMQYSGSEYPSMYSPAVNQHFNRDQNSDGQDFVAPSPYIQPGSQAAFQSPYLTMTPGPTSILGHQPQTPGSGIEHGAHDWQQSGLVVTIKPNATSSSSSLVGQEGYITNVNESGLTNLFLPQEDRTISVASHDLLPVRPGPNDRYRVIEGENRDQVGTLVSIDSTECICKPDSGPNELIFFNISKLCKIKPDL